MIAAERVAIHVAADSVAKRSGIKPCAALGTVLDLVETVDAQLGNLGWWDRFKLRVHYKVVIPSLRAIQATVCGSRQS